MASASCIALLLALFCGIASADWGTSNLTVAIGDSESGFVNLKLFWKRGECPLVWSHIYIESPDGVREKIHSTLRTEYTIENREYWTKYTVVVDSTECLFWENALELAVDTGPGEPHPVKAMHMVARSINATVVLEEANMPRIVDEYNVTYCSAKECKTKIVARNLADRIPSNMTVTLDELSPLTEYNVSVVPEIGFDEKKYRGLPTVSVFKTSDLDLPVPTHVETKFTMDENDTLHLKLTWEMRTGTIPVSHYNVTIIAEGGNSSFPTWTVNDTSVTINDLPLERKFKAEITPVFEYSNKMIETNTTQYEFTTPGGKRPSNFKAVNLSPNEVVAKWTAPPALHGSEGQDMKYSVTVKLEGKTIAAQESASEQITLDKLIKSTFYEIEIYEIPFNQSENTLFWNFTTLAQDYSPITELNRTFTEKDSMTTLCTLSWTSSPLPQPASSYDIEACDTESKECTSNSTKDLKFQIPLAYFSNYNITVTAVYKLDSDISVKRSNSSLLATPGTNPVKITSFSATDVSSANATLSWERPANIPAREKLTYQLSDDANNFSVEPDTETVTLENKLTPYKTYNVTIKPTVTYNNVNYTGEGAHFTFMSDVDAPGAVKNIEVKQKPYSRVAVAKWSAPDVANGPIDYYEVTTYDSEKKHISTISALTPGAQITLIGAVTSTTYNVSVRAVNLRNATNPVPLPGPFTSVNLTFTGIGAPEPEYVGRTASSLTFKLKPAKQTGDPSQVYFVARNWNETKFYDQKGVVIVDGLRPYTNETVRVLACHDESFCSEEIAFTHLTNVAGPSTVTNLKPSVVTETNPRFDWVAPSERNGPLDGYLVSLKNGTDLMVLKNETLPPNQTWYTFETEEEFQIYVIDVMAFNYNLDNKSDYVEGETESANVTTSGKCRPSKFDHVPLGLDSVYAKWAPPHNVSSPPNGIVYSVTVKLNGTQVSKNLTETAEITLVNLIKNTFYDVEIFVVPHNSEEDTLYANFTTLAQDYSPITKLNETFTEKDSMTTVCELSWTSSPLPQLASSYDIEACDSESKKCMTNSTKDSNSEFPLAYFSNYNITVTAVYQLKLNKTVRRTNSSLLATPGTNPVKITSFSATDVSSANATLSWDRPANIPAGVNRMYQVSDNANNFAHEPLDETVTLVNELSPYKEYNVSIKATITYNKQNFTGEEAYFTFMSDVAAPEAVKNIEVKQQPYSKIAVASWNAPDVANGPIDYYEVTTYDDEENHISTITALTPGAQIALIGASSSTTYNVSVRAVNLRNATNAPLPGPYKTFNLTFTGIEPPEPEYVSRTANSLTFKVKPAKQTSDPSKLYFLAENWNGTKFVDEKGLITANGLRPYTNETLIVSACHSESFCSEKIAFDYLTNVAGPSAVENLTSTRVGDTIPRFDWQPPNELNGPLDGYSVSFKDLTNSSIHKIVTLPPNETWFEFETEDEFETYHIDVMAFNYNLDNKNDYVKGEMVSDNVTTSGTHAPKPQNFRQEVKTTDEVEVAWDVPQFENWTVSWFYVSVPQLNMTAFTNITSLTFKKLKPYTALRILTQGCVNKTLSGCGLPRDFTAWTDVDCPSNVTGVATSNVNESSATVSWKRPDTPNGPLDGYLIFIGKDAADAKNISKWIFLSPKALSYNATKLDSDVKYNVFVKAFNWRGSKRLDSGYRPYQFSTVAEGKFPVLLVVFFLVVLAAAVVAGIFIFRRKRASSNDDTDSPARNQE